MHIFHSHWSRLQSRFSLPPFRGNCWAPLPPSSNPSRNRMKIKTSLGLHKLKACLEEKGQKKKQMENKICNGRESHTLRSTRDTNGEQQKIALGQWQAPKATARTLWPLLSLSHSLPFSLCNGISLGECCTTEIPRKCDSFHLQRRERGCFFFLRNAFDTRRATFIKKKKTRKKR